MEIQDELVEIERGFWKRGVPYYREMLDDEALMVFAEPIGVLNKTATEHAIASAPRWKSVEMSEVMTLALSDTTALLIYMAAAEQEDGTSYRARASSAYVRRDEGWRLAFHQQSSA